MRIVFIAPEEPFVIPTFFAEVLPATGDDDVALAIVKPLYRGSTWFSQAKRFARAFGVRDLLSEGAAYTRLRLLDLTYRVSGRGRPRSLSTLAREHGIPVFMPREVNAEDFLGQLRTFSPDMVISVACPQIFGEALLELPPLGCINVHSSLLPTYRGVLPTFWALANGERETGVTVHRIDSQIDGGGIIAQRRIPVRADDTLHSLMVRCKVVAAQLIIESLGRFRDGKPDVLPNAVEAGSYRSFPTASDVARFRRRGRRLR
ncbi:MAG: methionyl-tRNA formyltransferase [Actinomycetota bacterium]